MKRYITDDLIIWKEQKNRKPLILKGARQVGKTYILQHLGQEYFKKTHILNFEKNPGLADYFKENLEPSNIIKNISLHLKTDIEIGSDLLVFDEIQTSPRVLTSLKYFAEDMPGLHIVAAGSLLGLTLEDHSFPVGKVDEIEMYPLCFEEFLLAINETLLQELLCDPKKLNSISPPIHTKLLNLLRQYLVTGGLPEVLNDFVARQDNLFLSMKAVRSRQESIINQYLADISKHSGKINSMHISRIFDSIPAQLSRSLDASVQRFKFKGVVPKVSKYQRLASALDWLVAADLAIKVPIANSGNLPTQAFTRENIFKLFVFDIGILGALGGFDPQSILNYDFGTQKGYLLENFVLQELRANKLKKVCAWAEGTSEIEFILQVDGHTIPVEVKAGRSRHAKSLDQFRKKYQPPFTVIISENHLSRSNNQFNIPHYAVRQLTNILSTINLK